MLLAMRRVRTRRIRAGLVAVMAAALVVWLGLGVVERQSGAATAVSLPAATAMQDTVSGMARVIDGDTLAIGQHRIRLHGIDAPERDDSCRDAAGTAWRCGDWSTGVARGLAEGRSVTCRDLGERTHGRIVAQCFVGGDDLAANLLQAGAARACQRFAERHPHSQGYMALEAAATAAEAGIFAGTPPPRAGFCRPAGTAAGRAAAPGAAAPVVPASSTGNCRIKGNISRGGERIYHMPGQEFYDRTRIDTAQGERWFCTEAEARAAGWRRAQR